MLNLKEHLKLTVVYTFFAAFPAVLQLIIYPIIEGNDRLGATDFGYLAITEAIVSFIALFLLFGMAIAVARFYYDHNETKKDYDKLVTNIFQGVVFRTLLVLGIVFLFTKEIGHLFSEGPLQDFESYAYYLIIIAFNRSTIAIALSLYRSEKALNMFIIISLLSGIGRSVFQVIGVLYFDLSFKGYLLGSAVGGAIASVFIMSYVFYNSGISFSFSLNKKLYHYSFLLFSTDAIYWGILFFDRFMLMSKPNDLGIYDNALKFAMGVQFISQGLAGAIQPELFRLFKVGHIEKEKEIKTLSNLFVVENLVIICLATLPLMFFIQIFYETELILSSSLILIILMRTLSNALYQVFLWPILYVKSTKTYFLINCITVFLVVGLNYYLVPIYSYYGSVVAFLLATIIQIILFYKVGQKLIDIKWNKMKLLYFPIGVILFTLAMEYVKVYFSINEYLGASVVIAFIMIGLSIIYKIEITNNLNKLLKR